MKESAQTFGISTFSIRLHVSGGGKYTQGSIVADQCAVENCIATLIHDELVLIIAQFRPIRLQESSG